MYGIRDFIFGRIIKSARAFSSVQCIPACQNRVSKLKFVRYRSKTIKDQNGKNDTSDNYLPVAGIKNEV